MLKHPRRGSACLVRWIDPASYSSCLGSLTSARDHANRSRGRIKIELSPKLSILTLCSGVRGLDTRS